MLSLSYRLLLVLLLIHLPIAFTVLLAEESPSAADRLLANTTSLTMEGDIASHLVDGVDQFLLKQLEVSVPQRMAAWPTPANNPGAKPAEYDEVVATLRTELRERIGLRDSRIQSSQFIVETKISQPPAIGQATDWIAYSVRWAVFEGVDAEGILVVPANGDVRFCAVVVPDAGQVPEQLCGIGKHAATTAIDLARRGGMVVVPTVISRQQQTRNGRAVLTDQEFLYRPAFILGRHILGYQVQELMAAVDIFQRERPGKPVIVAGWGEGGWIALHAAAVDTRISATCVSGHFGPREKVWSEPIHRNVHGLLKSFGDAQLAAMIAPRILVIDSKVGPSVVIEGKGGAPGKLSGPSNDESRSEFELARQLLLPWKLDTRLTWVDAVQDHSSPFAASSASVVKLLDAINIADDPAATSEPGVWLPDALETEETRRQRTLSKWDRYQQRVLESIATERNEFWSKLDTSSMDAFKQTVEPYRDHFRSEVIGNWDIERMPANPRSRLIYDKPSWSGFEVVLDVFPGVIAYGVLLVPRDIQPNEKRPCVVFQHGLEGRPKDVIEGDHYAYHDVAAKLVEQGYIVFAPQNLYLFEDRFRTLQRKSNLLGKTLFSTIIAQHQQITDWLSTLPQLDAGRIAFYGLSYGGKSAMRIPALIPNYCLSICSADFNDWVWKNASTTSTYSYVWTGEYEIFEFGLGPKFNYAEMATLIAPRPFMVERGHFDGVAPDERVALEFAKVQHMYAAKLGIADDARIEWFVGPHTVNGKGTYQFLADKLDWPMSDAGQSTP